MKIDVQKFMEIRESAKTRQATTAKTTGKADWRALLESKRKEIGLESAAPAAAKVSAAKAENKIKAVAADFDGSIEERVGALRERSAEGLPVRELGNFIDVRA
ncbi:MAG: hypothetical protein FWC26_08670 [Fibromonadales bacterium]|nr:hypothetical protein [Fibromonadales bacterium]